MMNAIKVIMEKVSMIWADLTLLGSRTTTFVQKRRRYSFSYLFCWV
jgi:hypothetical protein